MHCRLVLAEHRLSNRVFESLAVVPPQPKTLEMQVITSLCEMSHDFKTHGSTVLLLCIWWSDKWGHETLPQHIKSLP